VGVVNVLTRPRLLSACGAMKAERPHRWLHITSYDILKRTAGDANDYDDYNDNYDYDYDYDYEPLRLLLRLRPPSTRASPPPTLGRPRTQFKLPLLRHD